MLTRLAACIYKRSNSNAGTVCCAADCGVRQEDDWRVKLNVKVDLVLCKIQIQLHICGSNGLQSLSAGPVGGKSVPFCSFCLARDRVYCSSSFIIKRLNCLLFYRGSVSVSSQSSGRLCILYL